MRGPQHIWELNNPPLITETPARTQVDNLSFNVEYAALSGTEINLSKVQKSQLKAMKATKS